MPPCPGLHPGDGAQRRRVSTLTLFQPPLDAEVPDHDSCCLFPQTIVPKAAPLPPCTSRTCLVLKQPKTLFSQGDTESHTVYLTTQKHTLTLIKIAC